MDKLIHMSLNSLDIALRKQAINAQNLSNANVNGYRRDIYESFGSVYLNARNQIESRAFSTTFGSGAFDETQGRITPTDVPTDLAIDGKGFESKTLFLGLGSDAIHFSYYTSEN